MLVLGIESSCDETGIALVEIKENLSHPKLLGQALHSQIKMHQEYGGVVPELASRDHIRRMVPLLQDLLKTTEIALNDIDVIAYTQGPGLAGTLLVGAGFANSLAFALKKPTKKIHHLEGHLLSPFLSQDPPEFPFVALLVSGGHTQLMLVTAVGCYQLLGETTDDAAGEAFDKSAKLMGLPYPGGPELAKIAQSGNPLAYQIPRPMLHSKDLDFSFSGLKTAVLTQLQTLERQNLLNEQTKADLAASTQAAIIEVLVKKSLKALKQTGIKRLVVAGGVSANKMLREQLNQECKHKQIRVHYPELSLCTDNGAMIAFAAAMRLQAGIEELNTDYSFAVRPRWPLEMINAT